MVVPSPGRSTIAVSPSVGEDTDGPPATGMYF